MAYTRYAITWQREPFEGNKKQIEAKAASLITTTLFTVSLTAKYGESSPTLIPFFFLFVHTGFYHDDDTPRRAIDCIMYSVKKNP